MSDFTFADLGLADPLLRALDTAGYSTPTPIQREAIPQILEGGDLLAAAQTGTGKTAGFTLPILQNLMAGEKSQRAGTPKVLILTPTRELAAQVEESVKTYGQHLPFKSMVMFGGVNIRTQQTRLKSPVDILVATPGRLLDHVGQRTVNLSDIEVLVLDEADRMLDMGFIHDIKRLLKILPKNRQNLLFSATFSDEIKDLADRLLNQPKLIEVAQRNTTSQLVTQRVHLVDRDKKLPLLIQLIKDGNWHQVLVFMRTKHSCNRVTEKLNSAKISAMALHGNKSQAARTVALKQFKSGELQVLVATDIAARGIDIDELPHVVNYELPNVPADYVHRIGRTGRAGSTGEALSLVCVDEFKFLRDIEKLIKQNIERFTIEGFEADLTVKPEPILRGGLGRDRPARTHSRQGTGQGSGQYSRNNNAPRSRSSAPSDRDERGTRSERNPRGETTGQNRSRSGEQTRARSSEQNSRHSGPRDSSSRYAGGGRTSGNADGNSRTASPERRPRQYSSPSGNNHSGNTRSGNR